MKAKDLTYKHIGEAAFKLINPACTLQVGLKQMEDFYSQAERSGEHQPDELHADQYRIGFSGQPR